VQEDRLLIRPKLIFHTRKGREIPNEPAVSFSPFEIEKLERQINAQFGDPIRRKVRKHTNGCYNCHGLTFLSRRAWLLKDADIRIVLSDDDYYEVAQNRVCQGDIILYCDHAGEIDHTGVVIDVPTDETIFCPWILSKWANYGEYIHRYNYCPYDARHVKFMREGRNDG